MRYPIPHERKVFFMKKYRVNVNGTSYEIEVELMGESETAAPAAPVAPAKPASAPAGGTSITAPMPGTILSVNVKDGQTVKKGDVLMILEAMKMENEITAPVDGKVSSVSVSKGTAVESGALLCVLA